MRGFMSYLKTGRVALTALGVLTAVATATVAAPAHAAWDNHGGHGRVVDRGDHGRGDHWRGGVRRDYRWGGPRGVYYPDYAYYPGYYDYYAPPYAYPAYPAPGIAFGFRVR